MKKIEHLYVDGEEAELTEYAKVVNLAEQKSIIDQHERKILSLSQGTPPYAASKKEMIDTSKIYLGSNGNLWVYGNTNGFESNSADWMDTNIKYANYSLTDTEQTLIAQKVLDILGVSYIALDNTINVGTNTLRYDSDDITDIGEVNV